MEGEIRSKNGNISDINLLFLPSGLQEVHHQGPDEMRSTVQTGGDQNQHHSQEGCKEGQDRQEGPITATRRTIARRRLRRLSPPRRPRAPAKRAKRARKKRRISRKNGQKFDM